MKGSLIDKSSNDKFAKLIKFTANSMAQRLIFED